MLGIAGDVETHPVRDSAAERVSSDSGAGWEFGIRGVCLTLEDDDRDDQQIRKEMKHAGSCQSVS
jgi:hypothetical protein